MSQLYVNLQGLERCAEEYRAMQAKVNSFTARTKELANIRIFGDANGAYKRKLKGIVSALENERSDMNDFRIALQQIALQYKQCEGTLLQSDEMPLSSVMEGSDILLTGVRAAGALLAGVNLSASCKMDPDIYIGSSPKDIAEQLVNWDITDIELVSKSYSDSAVYESILALESEEGHYYVDCGQVKLDANYSVSTGAISAFAGASISALSVDAEYTSCFGTTSVNAQVGTVEASLGGNIDLSSGDVSVKADLGAYVGKGEISHSGSVAGVEYEASASVNYGIGVEADIGFEGGKFNFELGATLGVGATVSFSVDVGSVWNAFMGLF